MELYKKHRPMTFAEVAGQPMAVDTLTGMIARRDVPHAFLFTGPSGCGKTTLARIMAKNIGCVGFDLQELNCAQIRGIDAIREIDDAAHSNPMYGRCRVWIIDEAHQLTKDAQSGSLKLLEDPPKTAYFFLCTNEPKKLLETIRTRCTEVTVVSLSLETLISIVEETALKESIELEANVNIAIAKTAEGSARKALVLLEQIRDMKTTDERLASIGCGTQKDTDAIEIARALMQKKPWKDVAEILRRVPDVKKDPEGLRHLVLGYAGAVILNGKVDPRAIAMIDEFGRGFYDSKWAGFVAACYAVTNG